MIKRLSHFGIYSQVNGLIVGLLLLLGLLIWLLVQHSTVDFLGHQMEKRGVDIGKYIAILSANDIVLDNNYALYERISNTRSNTEDVRYILITDSAGNIIVHTFTDGLPKKLNDLAAAALTPGEAYRINRYESNEGAIHEAIVPIENGDIGYVRVGMSDKHMQQFLNRKNTEIFVGILVMALAAAFAATGLTSVIIRPIRRLAAAVAEIRKGNLPEHVAAKGNDEVGLLTGAFNEMVDGLKQKQKENAHLLEELRLKEAMRAELISKLFTIQEEERKRIARELHDEAGQSLTSLLAYLKVLASRSDDHKQHQVLEKMRELAIGLLGEMKNMALELRPPVLDDHGIVAAMERHSRNFSLQYGILIRFSASVDKLIVTNDVSLALYRILQESLNNIAKHAAARSVSVTVKVDLNTVILTVADDGIGIAPQILEMSYENKQLGLYGMRERAELLGGTFVIQPGESGGTILMARFPVLME